MAPGPSWDSSGTARGWNEPVGCGVLVGMAPLTAVLRAGIAPGVLLLGLAACGSTSPGNPSAWPGSSPSVGRTGSPSVEGPASPPVDGPASSTSPAPPTAGTEPPTPTPSVSTGRRVPGGPGGSPSKGSTVTVSGIPEVGVEAGCLLLRGYLLVGGDRSLLQSGAPVTVVGHTDPDVASYCQQGTVLVVDSVSPAT